MTKPQPARDDTCPECDEQLGTGYYSQRKTCGCGAWLIYVMAGPTPRWYPVKYYDPQLTNQSPEERRPHIRLARAYP